MPSLSRFLALSDRSSTFDWMIQSSFQELQHPKHCQLACKHTQKVMDITAIEVNQHVKGLNNIISDILSRDVHLTEDQLTILFVHIAHSQMPK